MERFERSRERDPHSHVIHKPGRRLGLGVPLAFVWNKVSGKHGRSPNTALNLVSLIDFLVTTVIFLLSSFSASGAPSINRDLTLPRAENVEDLVEAPLVTVTRGQVLVDGSVVGSTHAMVESGRLEKVEELFATLKNKRDLWRQVRPGAPFPGVAILQVDDGVPASVVKNVFYTATTAGYPNVSFMVATLPHAR